MNTNKNQPYIIIPAYNESAIIKKTIQNLQNTGYHNIIVVDDCSTDNTFQKAQETGVITLKHLINRGQGASLRTGIEYVRENFSPEIIITFDADGQHQPKDIPKLTRPLINNEADIVLGSRFLEKDSITNITVSRKIMLKFAVLFTNIISGIKLTDTHNGFRALSKKAYRSIKITRRGMEHASEIIDEIRKKHLRFTEVPVHIIYSDYSQNKGQATGNFVKLGIKVILHKILN